MKKYLIISVILFAGVLIGYYSVPKLLSGIQSVNLNYYKTATNTSITCSGATSTIVLAASGQGQRSSFNLTNASSTSITLCRAASGCVSGSGLTIASSTGSFEQNDAYYGAYSCIGNGTSTTIGISYSQ